MTKLHEDCDRFGCARQASRLCVICVRVFCELHEFGPKGHACLSDVPVFNADRVLDLDEVDAALARFEGFS